MTSRHDVGRARKPQNENGIATYRRIVEAALDVLATRGWRHASVAEVAHAAGVTRGAIQHHFKDRDGLFTAAMQYVMDERIRRIEELRPAAGSGGERTREIVHTVVDMHQGATFAAGLHLCVAAAADPNLTDRVAAMELEVGARGFWAIIELLGLNGNDPTVRTTVQAFLDSARGLGLAGMLNDDSRRRAKVADRWADMLDELRDRRRE
ncbi:MAG: TetR/AcrR family transcriptional regulator [Mycobacteriaceae bacterium]|nr:TetR/AcrR family transcriptional regulator [Mycobacteriaceae bacterium]